MRTPKRKGYYADHARVRQHRGPAKDQTCVRCGEQAYDWAQVHGSNPRDIWGYQPMCRPCHRHYDQPQGIFIEP